MFLQVLDEALNSEQQLPSHLVLSDRQLYLSSLLITAIDLLENIFKESPLTAPVGNFSPKPEDIQVGPQATELAASSADNSA